MRDARDAWSYINGEIPVYSHRSFGKDQNIKTAHGRHARRPCSRKNTKNGE